MWMNDGGSAESLFPTDELEMGLVLTVEVYYNAFELTSIAVVSCISRGCDYISGFPANLADFTMDPLALSYDI